MTNQTMTVQGKEYAIEGTITMPEKVRKVTGAVLWVVLVGGRGAHYTLACYENGGTAFYRGEFSQLIGRNVEAR